MTRRPLTILVSLALAAALPRCGGGKTTGGGGGSVTPSGTVTQTPTRSPKPGRQVGSVLTVVLPDAFIQGNKAFDDDPIRERQAVSTNEKGSVDFGLSQKIKTCRLFQDSEVVAAPASGLLLRYQAGTAWCFTTTDPSVALTVGPSNVEFAMSDPLYGVTVGAGGVTLRVVQGVVDVRPSDPKTGPSLLVGPGQQVTIAGGSVPSTAEDFNTESLPKDQADTVSLFRSIIPKPDFGAPDPDGSPGLQRILEATQTIHVGIDAKFVVNPIEQSRTRDWEFVDLFFSILADHWGIASVPVAIDSDEARRALDDGKIDVFVTPQPSPDLASFPLFGGLEGRTWSVSFPVTDQPLGASVRNFVLASLQRKDYVIAYSRAFGIDHPPLDPLRPMLGL